MKKILILFCFLSSVLVNAQIIRTPQTFGAKITFLDSIVGKDVRVNTVKTPDGYLSSQTFVTKSIHDSLLNVNVDTVHKIATKYNIFSKENTLGNPSGNGYILSSTTSGVRSWIAPPTSAAWGNITGNLSNQTDLQNALNSIVSFPGFGTTNSTAARGDHLHTGVYQPVGSYLTSESDPIYSGSAAAGINSSNIAFWNNKLTKSTTTVENPDSVWVVVDGTAHRSVVSSIPYGYYTNINAVGTPYNLTNTSAYLTFGSYSPQITLSQSGTWKVQAGVYINYATATVSSQTITFKLRRTNNTAADLSISPTLNLTPCTSVTGYGAYIEIPPIWYTTSNATDIIQLWGNISATLSAGNIQVVGAWITAEKIVD